MTPSATRLGKDALPARMFKFSQQSGYCRHCRCPHRTLVPTTTVILLANQHSSCSRSRTCKCQRFVGDSVSTCCTPSLTETLTKQVQLPSKQQLTMHCWKWGLVRQAKACSTSEWPQVRSSPFPASSPQKQMGSHSTHLDDVETR